VIKLKWKIRFSASSDSGNDFDQTILFLSNQLIQIFISFHDHDCLQKELMPQTDYFLCFEARQI